MDKKCLAKKMNHLAQVDVDAAIAYEQASQWVFDKNLNIFLKQFLKEHQQHIVVLKRLIKTYDKQVCHYCLDLKGSFFKLLLFYFRLKGVKGILRALQINEQRINHCYEKILCCDLPTDIKKIVEKNYADERRHLAYISQAINDKI